MIRAKGVQLSKEDVPTTAEGSRMALGGGVGGEGGLVQTEKKWRLGRAGRRRETRRWVGGGRGSLTWRRGGKWVGMQGTCEPAPSHAEKVQILKSTLCIDLCIVNALGH
jgi:hypothetical protein